jgi:hypothetical protein
MSEDLVGRVRLFSAAWPGSLPSTEKKATAKRTLDWSPY